MTTIELPTNRPEYFNYNGKPYAALYKRVGSELTDKCPFCSKKHGHGTGGAHMQHRLAHCDTGRQKETITAQDGTVLSHSDGYMVVPYQILPASEQYTNLMWFVEAIERKELPVSGVNVLIYDEAKAAQDKEDFEEMQRELKAIEAKYNDVIIAGLQSVGSTVLLYGTFAGLSISFQAPKA